MLRTVESASVYLDRNMHLHVVRHDRKKREEELIAAGAMLVGVYSDSVPKRDFDADVEDTVRAMTGNG